MKSSKIKSPRLAKWLMRTFLNNSHKQYIIGDFEEIYAQKSTKNGKLFAFFWYWGQVVKSFPSFIINQLTWNMIMFKNYAKITFRNIIRHKTFSFINFFGLAVGIACCLLIYLWVQDEISYDNFHKNKAQIHRVVSVIPEFGNYEGTPFPLSPKIAEEIPEIISSTRVISQNRKVIKNGDIAYYEDKGIIVDPSFFEIFSFPFVSGTAATAFSTSKDLVITESLAKRFFGDEDPIGKMLFMDEKEYNVSAVLKNIPVNSHMQFSFLSSFQYGAGGMGSTWHAYNFVTFVQLTDPDAFQSIGDKIHQVGVENNSSQLIKDNAWKFELQPLSEVYFDNRDYVIPWMVIGNKDYVKIFSLAAILILIIACANYMNLSTARSSVRFKEIGVRKIVGAERKQIIIQFFMESFLYTFLAFLAACLIIVTVLPYFNEITGKLLDISYFNLGHISVMIGLLFTTSIISGIYPAIVLSSFSPINVIKGSFDSRSKSKLNFRQFLVISQFAISIILIFGTIVINKQLSFVKDSDLGFKKENVITIPIKKSIGKNYSTLKNELLQNSNIISVASQYYSFTQTSFRNTNYNWDGKDPDNRVDMIFNYVDYDYFNTLEIQVADGRLLSKEFATDAESGFILNEQAIREMNIESPIGKNFSFGRMKGSIVGVIKDANFKSLHEEINPHVFMALPDASEATAYGSILIRVKGVGVSNAVNTIKSIWEKVSPDAPFEYKFLDEDYANFYKKETKAGLLLNQFTILAIMISCLGLFGLAAFITEQRTKEIGIRKVLGAKTTGIIYLLSLDFSKWVLSANVISIPICYYLMNKFLENFAYKADIGNSVYFIAGFSTLAVALMTVLFQTYKSASSDPSKTLKYE